MRMCNFVTYDTKLHCGGTEMEKMQAQRGRRRRIIVGIIIACGVANAAVGVASHGSNSSREESDVASLVEKRVVRADSIVVRALRTSFDLIKELQRFFNHEE